MDEILKIIRIEELRNQKKYTVSSLISEMLDIYMKVNNYPEDLSEETINSFNKMVRKKLESRKKL